MKVIRVFIFIFLTLAVFASTHLSANKNTSGEDEIEVIYMRAHMLYGLY